MNNDCVRAWLGGEIAFSRTNNEKELAMNGCILQYMSDWNQSTIHHMDVKCHARRNQETLLVFQVNVKEYISLKVHQGQQMTLPQPNLKECYNWFWKGLFQTHEQFCVWKNDGEPKKKKDWYPVSSILLTTPGWRSILTLTLNPMVSK